MTEIDSYLFSLYPFSPNDIEINGDRDMGRIRNQHGFRVRDKGGFRYRDNR